MNSQRTHPPTSKGQILIIFIVISTALIGMLALGIDSGLTMAVRRAAQNAADAGALAGARELCAYDDPVTAANNAITRAYEYAQTKNKVRNNTWVASPSVNLNTAEVTVDVTASFDTLVANFFGQPTLTVAATATAACLPPGTGKGIIPISWRCYEVNASGELDPDCDLQYIDQGDSCTPGDDFMYIFIDSDSSGVKYDCAGSASPDPTFMHLDCDFNDNGVIDAKPIDNMNPEKPWFWVDLAGSATTQTPLSGTSTLADWINNGYPNSVPTHTWLFGRSGVAVSLYFDVDDQTGKEVAIPVFDDICAGANPQTDCPFNPVTGTGWHSGQDQAYLKTSNSPIKYYFHLATFAILHLNCSDNGWAGKNNSGCPVNSLRYEMQNPDIAGAGTLEQNDPSIEGCFVQGVIPGSGGSPGGGKNAGAFVLYLTR